MADNCNCPDGYYHDGNDNCAKCSDECATCDTSGCLTCVGDDGEDYTRTLQNSCLCPSRFYSLLPS